MNKDHFKWIVGAVAIPMGLLLIGAMSQYQRYIDDRQDKATIKSEETIERVADNQRRTAEALALVANTVNEIDARGSLALRGHERLRDGEAH